MGAQNQTSVNLVGVGGTSPYAYTILQDAQTTITATLSGSLLTVDATAVPPGTYSVHVQITDQTLASTTTVIPIRVASSAIFSILTEDLALQPSTFPQTVALPLTSIGGTGQVTWSLLPITTLPNASILNGSTLNFVVTTFGNWTVGLRATDTLGNTVSRLIQVQSVAGGVTSLVDGQVEMAVTPNSAQVGTHTFSLKVTDSANSAPLTQTFNYNVAEEVATILVPEASVDHFWGAGDTTSVVYPILGDLTGFTLAQEGSTVAANGLTVTVDTTNNALVVTGPPTSFSNAEIDASIAVMKNATEVAILTRNFTLISHSGTSDLGTMTCNTRPYITGEFVGLNPLRPFFNSPTVVKNQGYTVQVQGGSTLPQGLSLDAVTGQVYGTVLAADVATTALQYVDASGTVHGTVTIVWDICVSQFTLLSHLTTGQVQATYSGTIGSSSSAPLTTVTLHRGVLPQGLQIAIDSSGLHVVIQGTPIEAGYFDCWLRVTNQNGQIAFFHTRFVVEYITPLVILTDTLDRLTTGQAFAQTLQAFGGIAPYTWTLLAGTLPTGLTLAAASGILSGTTTATTFNANLTFEVTDHRGVSATAALNLLLNNTLTIVTAVLPMVTPGQSYTLQMEAEGGQSPYTWALASGSPALPGGFTLSSTGLLSGATSLQSYNQNVILQVTDSASNSVSGSFNLLIGQTSGLLIDTEGIGPLVRGQNYQGQLSVLGPGVAPYQWSVTPDTPNPLPAGLVLTSDASTQGASATLSGVTSQSLVNFAVKIRVIDANGNSANSFLLLSTYSTLAVTTPTPLPQGTVAGSYSVQNTAAGVNTPFVWSLDPTSGPLPGGLTLTSAGLISGQPTTAGAVTFILRVTDSLGDFANEALTLTTTQSTLAITTASLPTVTAGIAYSTVLAATGGVPGYTWSISPNSTASLPSGLTLNPSSGTLSGTTLAASFSNTIVFRVTDSIGVIREASLALSVLPGLQILSGPDFTDGTTTNSLGIGYSTIEDVTSIHPRPNLSFYLVCTNVISTQASQMSVLLPPGFTGTVDSIGNGQATIRLSGPFYSPNLNASTPFNVTVLDSGVSVSKTFTYAVAPQTTIRFTTAAGTLPTTYQS